MIQRLKTKQKGFTIIEVMIVLAIAGLILLIVFLAVPALQRAQRNTGRKEDAGRFVTAFQDFISNSSGNLPALTSSTTSDCNSIVTDAGTLNQYKGLSCVSSLNANNQIAIENNTTAQIPPAPQGGSDVLFVEGATCSGTSTFKVSSTEQQAVLFYSLEAGGGKYAWACENA
ncbi:MAG: type II secretion system GspH family protein [Patescibacteria group bacterium]|jgi:prepilin-type N-terminal cleavage/methylation domain-containing protein|nr:type II secretion system GspH family protein [Patescibacteria group bacterium]